jgi:hypothetical protein
MTYEMKLSIEDRIASLFFQPDPCLPVRYFQTFRKIPLEPEIKLMLAVLEDAIMCVQKYARNGKKRRLFREAEEWLLEEADDWLFSFENICSVLGLDPSYLRHGLLPESEKLLTESPRRRLEAKIGQKP